MSTFDDQTRDPRRLGELFGLPSGKEDGPPVEPLPFPLVRVTVKAAIVGDCAVTELEERYANPHDRPMGVRHTIPLPAEGAVVGFEIVAGDRTVKGVCRKRGEAAAEYAVARMRGNTAALVESHRDDLHAISLANVPAKTEVTVRLRIVERLRCDDGRFEYRFPTTVSPKFVPVGKKPRDANATIPNPPARLDGGTELDFELTCAAGVTELSSPLALVREDRNDGTIRLRLPAGARCTGDLVVRTWSRTETAEVRAYGDGERTLVVVDPPSRRRPELEKPRVATFVLDRSGSMGGTRLAAAKRTIAKALADLGPDDRFELFAFDHEVIEYRPEPTAVSGVAIAKAIAWLDAIEAQGGTEALPALERACRTRPSTGAVRTLLFVTDGDIGNDQEVLAFTRTLDPATRLFVVGIGLSPSAGALVRLARLGGGTHLFLDDRQDIEAEMNRFASALAGPMACGLGIEGADRFPGRDLFAGRSATFFVDGTPESIEVASIDGSFRGSCRVGRSPVPLGPLWARERVADLEDRIVARPDERTLLEGQIEELGVRHAIQTRMTSFVAIDEASRVEEPAIELVQPSDLPEDAELGALRCCSISDDTDFDPLDRRALYSFDPAGRPRHIRTMAQSTRTDAPDPDEERRVALESAFRLVHRTLRRGGTLDTARGRSALAKLQAHLSPDDFKALHDCIARGDHEGVRAIGRTYGVRIDA